MSYELFDQARKYLPTSFISGLLPRECDKCHEKKPALQRSAINSAPGSVPPIVHEVLRTPGQPLDSDVRAFMEPRFGHDFGQVRIHTDDRAAKSAQAANALAYTVRHDVVFDTAHYAPGTLPGQRLLAHELTHLVQQSKGNVTGTMGKSSPEISSPSDPLEREATRISGSIVSSGAGTTGLEAIAPREDISAASGTQLLRQVAPSSAEDVDLELAMPASASMAGSLTIDRFELDKAILTKEHLGALSQHTKKLQKILKRYPDSFASVVGHTDASGTEEHNEKLGQERADAVRSELIAQGISGEILRAASLGERSLIVPTKAPEPRNRRVEILFQSRNFMAGRFGTAQSPPMSLRMREGETTTPKLPPSPPRSIFDILKIPDIKNEPKNWLEEALKQDRLLRTLPRWARDKAIDALKDADEMAADKIIDAMPWGGKEKEAAKAAIKSILQLLKGKRFKEPTPPLHEMPPSASPKFQEMPGQVIIPLWEKKW